MGSADVGWRQRQEARVVKGAERREREREKIHTCSMIDFKSLNCSYCNECRQQGVNIYSTITERERERERERVFATIMQLAVPGAWSSTLCTLRFRGQQASPVNWGRAYRSAAARSPSRACSPGRLVAKRSLCARARTPGLRVELGSLGLDKTRMAWEEFRVRVSVAAAAAAAAAAPLALVSRSVLPPCTSSWTVIPREKMSALGRLVYSPFKTSVGRYLQSPSLMSQSMNLGDPFSWSWTAQPKSPSLNGWSLPYLRSERASERASLSSYGWDNSKGENAIVNIPHEDVVRLDVQMAHHFVSVEIMQRTRHFRQHSPNRVEYSGLVRKSLKEFLNSYSTEL